VARDEKETQAAMLALAQRRWSKPRPPGTKKRKRKSEPDPVPIKSARERLREQFVEIFDRWHRFIDVKEGMKKRPKLRIVK